MGWSHDVETAELSRWVADQDARAMLAEHAQVGGGSRATPCWCRRALPHAIGEGIFAVELQEPTDFSVMLEFKGFDLDPAGGELGPG